MKHIFLVILIIIASLATLLVMVAWMLNFHPDDIMSAPVICSSNTPLLKPGQRIKVLSWNVQYMAGKNYCFFYEGGEDERPSVQDINATLKAVAHVINDENPDIVLLQEVDDGARRTGYQDQLIRLLNLLQGGYPCRASAFYWKSGFVPHPRIMGAVGMKLVILSKFRISSAVRFQLPLIPENPVVQQFNLKRALLEVRMPMANGGVFVAANTHLSAFAQGTDTMEKQVKKVRSILGGYDIRNILWVAGGDFNLLPPGKAYRMLPKTEQKFYNPATEIKPLFDDFPVIPSLKDINGPGCKNFFTHFPNRPSAHAPDRTIDYIFYSTDLQVKKYYIRQKDTLSVSDHLPVVGEFWLPKQRRTPDVFKK